MVATDTAVVEMEELQDVIAEGRELGFLTLDTVLAALEEAELDRDQTQDLLSQLEEHSIEIIGPAEPGPESRLAEDEGDGHASAHDDDDRSSAVPTILRLRAPPRSRTPLRRRVTARKMNGQTKLRAAHAPAGAEEGRSRSSHRAKPGLAAPVPAFDRSRAPADG